MAQAKVTTDHDEIREWAEARGGRPAAVRRTHSKDNVGIIRIEFPDAPNAKPPPPRPSPAPPPPSATRPATPPPRPTSSPALNSSSRPTLTSPTSRRNRPPP